MKKAKLLGWIFGALTALCWAAYAIIMRVGSTYFDNIHSTSFVLTALISGSFALLIGAGSGRLSISTIRNSFTWQYGTLQIINNVALMAAFSYALTSTSATLLLRAGIVIAAIINLLMSGKSKISNKWGFASVMMGLYLVFSGIDIVGKGIAVLLVLMSAFTQVLQVRTASTHNESVLATGDVKTEMRVTGYILSVTAMVYAITIGAISFAGESELAGLLIPTKDQLLSLDSLSLAFFTGLVIIAPMKYFEFTSTKHIGSTNFLTIVAFTPLLTFSLEGFMQVIDILPMADISFYELAGGTFIIFGVLMLVRSSVKQDRIIKNESMETRHMRVARERIEATLTYFDGNKAESAKALNIKESTLEKILKGQKEYSKKNVQKIKDNFNDNVAMRDPITKLQNRLMFITNLNRMLNSGKVKNIFTLYYLDLNDFKPINDTYGHEAGDFILKEISKRLHDKLCGVAEICRLGGDEFALTVINSEGKEQKFATIIEEIIIEKISLDKVSVGVGVSIGWASSNETSNPNKLLDIADKRMQKNKEESKVGR